MVLDSVNLVKHRTYCFVILVLISLIFVNTNIESDKTWNRNLRFSPYENDMGLSVFEAHSRYKVQRTNYMDHDPITIMGNLDFLAQATSEGWPGVGSKANPIIIKNLEIISSGGFETAISIWDTNLFFQLTNCILTEAFEIISLHNVENANISHNVVRNTNGGNVPERTGIVLFGGSSNTILNNTVDNCEWAIRVEVNSKDNFISNNTLYDCNSGISLDSSHNVTISRNVVYNNGPDGGINLRGSTNSVISDNQIYDNEGDGLILFGSRSNLIHNNTVTNNSGAIALVETSNDNEVSENLLTGNVGGLQVWGSDRNLLTHNEIGNGYQDGLVLSSSTFNIVSHNSIYNNFEGIGIVEGSSNNLIYNNTIFNNPAVGIYLSQSSNKNNITGNYVYNNNNGLRLHTSCNNSIVNNIINHNIGNGILLLSSSDNNIISYNEILNNTQYGIQLEEANFNLISNNYFIENGIDNSEGSSQASIILPSEYNIFAFNFWDDWLSSDINGDGFADSPYKIDGGFQDDFPLISQDISSVADIITDMMFIFPLGGETVHGLVKIQWLPSLDVFGHTVMYSLYYSVNNGENWILIIANIETVYWFWDTTAAPEDSSCILKIFAICSEGVEKELIIGEPILIDNHGPPPNLSILIVIIAIVLVIPELYIGRRFSKFLTKLQMEPARNSEGVENP
ncbi:hypothetical protein CEE45_14455 [Candidatus Heimdallarchaeota archaeon B3_Heim]|nr:MAG: hypothetical protein CEE45_14455 [Candidatus Heimdallarchaeota archaeon B3_Heim]